MHVYQHWFIASNVIPLSVKNYCSDSTVAYAMMCSGWAKEESASSDSPASSPNTVGQQQQQQQLPSSSSHPASLAPDQRQPLVGAVIFECSFESWTDAEIKLLA